MVSETRGADYGKIDREQLILDAALGILAERGASGVSIRAVAKQAGVAAGLVHYYFEDKTALVAAVLRRTEEADLLLVRPDPSKDSEANLRAVLRRVASAEFLNTAYLSLRLQLWALAQTDQGFEEINVAAQKRYRKGLSDLIRAARPQLSRAEANRRAADISIVQNGMWVSSLLGVGRPAVKRSVKTCEDIAFG